jgi:hypothetical protein
MIPVNHSRANVPVATTRGEIMQKRRFAPSPALVVSLIALFVALGGTSYAAITTLPANSVGTKQLKNNAVTGSKLKDGAITAAKISHSALKAATVVGAPGAPAYAGTWAHPGASVDEGASFYKDPWGIVHLQGSVSHNGAATGTIFTLPTGYRPAGNLFFAAYGNGGTAAYVQVMSDGEVVEFSPAQAYVGLSGISFRAGL